MEKNSTVERWFGRPGVWGVVQGQVESILGCLGKGESSLKGGI